MMQSQYSVSFLHCFSVEPVIDVLLTLNTCASVILEVRLAVYHNAQSQARQVYICSAATHAQQLVIHQHVFLGYTKGRSKTGHSTVSYRLYMAGLDCVSQAIEDLAGLAIKGSAFEAGKIV